MSSRINVGKVAPIPKGNWVQSQSYEKLNMVNNGGVLYIAKEDVPANTAITNTNYWMPASGKFSIGTVGTVSSSTGASATITDGAEGPILNLNIPRGVTGNESIDDTKGEGDTDYVWSANKNYEEINKLYNDKLDTTKTTELTSSVVTFGAENDHAIKDLTVAIEPVQDLHGYDAPWPAGGGKNLLPNVLEKDNEATVSNGVTFTKRPDGTILVNGTATGGQAELYLGLFQIEAGKYASLISNTAVNVSLQLRKNGSGGAEIMPSITTTHQEVTISEVTTIYSRLRIAEGLSVNNAIVYPMFAKQDAALTVADFEPYNNICPISGHTSAIVSISGKNLINSASFVEGTFINDNGIEQSSTTAKTSGLITVKQNLDYTFSGTQVYSSYHNKRIHAYDANGNWISQLFSGSKGSGTYTISVTTPSNACYLRFCVYKTDTDLQLELGSTATAYEPYQDTSVTVNLGDTRYGGTLDVLTGLLTVDRWVFEPTKPNIISSTDDANYKRARFNVPEGYSIKNIADSTVLNTEVVCNRFKTITSQATYRRTTEGISDGNTNNCIYIFKEDLITIEQWEVWIANNPLQIVYPLASPFTVQLTPSQLSTLLGTNHLWADTGDSTVTLRLSTGDLAYQDTVDYETQVTNKPDFGSMLSGSETSMVATKNYTKGSLIAVGDDLYKATSAIASGSNIVVGSNVVATTIEAEVNAGLNTKANAANVYTKTETDEMLYTKACAIENTVSGNQTITDGADGIPVKEIKIVLDPMQEGSGTPTPENVRPVTPYTKLNFAMFGKNWLPAAPAGTWTQNGVTFTSDGNGGYTYIGKSTAETLFFVDVGEYILPSSGYIHLMNSSNSNFISFGFAYNGTALDPQYIFSTVNRKAVLDSSQAGMRANQIVFKVGNNINVTALRTLSPMVLETNDLMPFTPYGRTISVDWEDEAGTVYSGIYDVTTGILTVDSARVMLADLTWTQNAVTEHAFDSKIPDRLAGAYTSPAAYSNIYKMYTAASLHNYTYGFGYGTGIILYVKDDRADTPADMVQLFQNEGTYIVYKLASPVTYQFDPSLFKTVYGENHIWTDDIGSPEVTYRADTKLYITRIISEQLSLLSGS